ncbi:MAG: carbon-nitrogen family hydrolase [Desulfobacterales bacterium]|nr:carbon-nitrogen family hydrolase [Desulfobacterales bacterium]MCP4164047.1 carbon-nitrogen family hydrolase [Deltaproteobacteria bacterium]
MERKLKTAVFQFDTKTGMIDENLAYVIERIPPLNADLVVLPEMWSCGFDYSNLKSHAEKTPYVLDELSKVAIKENVMIAGSYPEMRDGDIYNTAYLIDKDGEIKGTYSKVHLFSHASEDKYFKAGDKAVVVDTSIGKIGFLICYDLRFPEFFRTLALDGAEIVIVMGQWPKVRIDHWNKLLAARAIENQLFVLAANRIGTENLIEYGGCSKILSPVGKTLSYGYSFETIVEFELDFEEMTLFREKIPCFEERVKGVYKI